MMNKTQSSPLRAWRYLLLLPVLTLTAGLLSATLPTDTSGNKYLAEKNGMLYGVITPATSDKDLEEIKSVLAEKNKTLSLPVLKRNTDGSIDRIVFEINDAGSHMSMKSTDEPMKTFFFYTNEKEGGISVYPFGDMPQGLLSVAINESKAGSIKGFTTDSSYANRFPGGNDAYSRALSKTIRYPRVCQENNIAGNVKVQYKIRPDGAISDVEVLSAPHKALGDEVKRAIEALPAFLPEPSGKTETVTMQAAYMLEKPNGEYIRGPELSDANHSLVIVGYTKR